MPTILVLESDDRAFRSLSTALQGKVRAELELCKSAQEGLERITETDFDAIIADIRLAGVSKLTLLEEIRARRPNTPIVLTSAAATSADALNALRTGAFDFITKPYDLDYLIKSLNAAVSLSRINKTVVEKSKQLELRAAEFQALAEARALALAHTRIRLEQAVEAGQTGTWELDLKNNQFYWSPLLEKICGLTEGQFKGSLDELYKFVHPDDAANVKKEMEIAISQDTDVQLEYRIIHSSGAVRWLRVRGKRFFDDNGAPSKLAGVCVDITDRRNATDTIELEREKFRITLNSIGDAVIATDQVGNLSFMNPIAERLTGWTTSAAVGKPMDQIFTIINEKTRKFEPNPVISVLRDGKAVALENHTIVISKAGIETPIEDSAAPIINKNGEIAGVVLVFRDVSKEKKIQAERDELMRLEQEARAESERANLAKDDFFATLSHELRSPLTPMLGWSRLLKKGDLDETERKQGIDVIERNVLVQAKLIDDILDMSRIMTGKLALTVGLLDFNRVIAAAVDIVHNAADAKRIDLQVTSETSPLTMIGDSDRLQQVVWNLLTNAVKFTPKNGKISIKTELRNSSVIMVVTDSGSGIPADFIPHLFERFSQANNSSTRVHGGLGIGLSLVKQLVELHGGTVVATSDGEAKGSSFTVNLPIRAVGEYDDPQVPPQAAVAKVAKDMLSGLKILIVDDEPDARELIGLSFRKFGAKTILADSADDGFAKFKEGAPDLLVSDIGMPVKGGLEFIHMIRKHENGDGKVPAVALSAYASDKDGRRSLEAGFQLHMAKPVDPTELVKAAIILLKR